MPCSYASEAAVVALADEAGYDEGIFREIATAIVDRDLWPDGAAKLRRLPELVSLGARLIEQDVPTTQRPLDEVITGFELAPRAVGADDVHVDVRGQVERYGPRRDDVTVRSLISVRAEREVEPVTARWKIATLLTIRSARRSRARPAASCCSMTCSP
jgi:hypothetical protein